MYNMYRHKRKTIKTTTDCLPAEVNAFWLACFNPQYSNCLHCKPLQVTYRTTQLVVCIQQRARATPWHQQFQVWLVNECHMLRISVDYYYTCKGFWQPVPILRHIFASQRYILCSSDNADELSAFYIKTYMYM